MTEIIIVDNFGDDCVRQLCSEYGVVYAIEKKPGCAAARNTGIAMASHEILAFTDSDVIPPPTWLASGVRRFLSTSNCGFVAGAVEIFTQGKPHPTLAEQYETLTGFPIKMYMEKHGFGVHANMFTSASVVRTVGPLNPELVGAEDWEWGRRFASTNFTLEYDDTNRVLHPARMTVAQLVKKVRRATFGFCQWNKDPKPRIRFIIYHLALLGIFRRRWPERIRDFTYWQRSKIFALSIYLQWVAAFECTRILLTSRTTYRR